MTKSPTLEPIEKPHYYLTASEDVMGGNPCLSNSRIPISILWKYKQKGWTIKDIANGLYPYLKGREKDIRLCIKVVKYFNNL